MKGGSATEQGRAPRLVIVHNHWGEIGYVGDVCFLVLSNEVSTDPVLRSAVQLLHCARTAPKADVEFQGADFDDLVAQEPLQNLPGLRNRNQVSVTCRSDGLGLDELPTSLTAELYISLG